MELYATIKKGSKYAYQGREQGSGKLILFPICQIRDDPSCGYCFRMGGNQYRREDLNFFVKTPRGELIKLNGR